MIKFSEEFDASRPAMMLRITGLAYVANLLPLLAAFLPRDASVVWSDLAIGGALYALALVIFVQQAHAARQRIPSAPVALVQNVLVVAALGCFSYALSGDIGIYRIILVGPLLLMAVLGNRTMFVVSYLACAATVVVTTVGTVGVKSPQLVAGVSISYALGFLVVALFVRELAQSAVRDAHQTKRFADLTMVAARADSVDAGLADMLPTISRYLNADRVSVFTVTNRVVESEARCTWSAHDDDEGHGPSVEQWVRLRIAATDNKTLVDAQWSCFSVKTETGAQLVVLVERPMPELRQRTHFEAALEDVATQLGVLLTRVDLYERLETLTRTDALTDLPNRRSLTERLESEMAVARRTESAVSVVMIDLDLFKSYNDTYGHVAGDELLRGIADMMRTRLRATDFVARYGGEEFCAILPFTDAGNAAIMFAELHRRCGELDALTPVTFSAGVSEWDGEETITELLMRADEAMYQAKAGGRDQTQIALSWPELEIARDPRPIVQGRAAGPRSERTERPARTRLEL